MTLFFASDMDDAEPSSNPAGHLYLDDPPTLQMNASNRSESIT